MDENQKIKLLRFLRSYIKDVNVINDQWLPNIYDVLKPLFDSEELNVPPPTDAYIDPNYEFKCVWDNLAAKIILRIFEDGGVAWIFESDSDSNIFTVPSKENFLIPELHQWFMEIRKPASDEVIKNFLSYVDNELADIVPLLRAASSAIINKADSDIPLYFFGGLGHPEAGIDTLCLYMKNYDWEIGEDALGSEVFKKLEAASLVKYRDLDSDLLQEEIHLSPLSMYADLFIEPLFDNLQYLHFDTFPDICSDEELL